MNATTTLEHNYHQIKGPDGTLFVDDGGTGNVPVVFLHSFGGNINHWTNQLDHLRETRRAVAFDLRGHGKSDNSSRGDYSAEALASDIVAVVDSLDMERFVLVGHSMGGSAAIAYADLHPSRVAGLVLSGTPGKTPSEISKPVISSLRSEGYQKVMDGYMSQLVTGAKPEVASMVNEAISKISPDTSIQMIGALFEFDPIEKVRRFSGSKLIIFTTREGTQPNSLHNQVPEIPNKVMEGTSHWTQLDKPEQFNAILDEFLAGIDKKELR